jgi:hypothetical protein
MAIATAPIDTESPEANGIDTVYEAALADLMPAAPVENIPGAREAADALADAIGEDRANVRVIRADWASMLKLGAHVELHIGRWRAESALTLEDLGIQPKNDEEAQALRRRIKLGTGYLLPKDILDEAARLEDKARQLLRPDAGYCYQTHWGYFIPETPADPERGKDDCWLFKEWRAKVDQLSDEYMALGRRVFAQWDDLIKRVASDYAIIGFQNYERLRAAGRNDLGEIEDFIRAFVRRRMAKVPSKQRVLESWKFDVEIGFVPLAMMMAQDQAGAAQVLAEQGAKNELQRLKIETSRREIETGVKQFATDCQATLSNLVYDVVTGALAAIQKNGEVPGASVKALRNLVDKVSQMKFWDDATLEAQMAEVRMLLAAGSLNDRVPEVRNVMRRIGAEARLTLMELECVPERSARAVGIPDSIGGLRATINAGRRVAAPVALELADVAPTGAGRAAADTRGL